MPTNRGVTCRAIAMGVVGCLTLSAGEPISVLVMQSSPMAADYSTGAALFLFFLLTLVFNPLAKILTGSRLSPRELATVYIMMVVGAAIPSWGLVMNLIPMMGGFVYYATVENDWIALIHPYLPASLVVNDYEAIQKLFEGISKGETIPWAVWLRPLLGWSLFIATLYFTTLCLLVILRKQWVERERLNFPLATLPLEMSANDHDETVPPFFRNYLTWIGFAIPAFIGSVNALHRYFNFVPWIDLNVLVPVMRNSVWINFRPLFEVMGLSYLLNLDVSMGIWFFAMLNMLAMGALRMLGWSLGPEQPYSSPAPPSIAHLALGAMFFLVFSSMWSGRHHLKAVWRKAWQGDDSIDDSEELLSYRVAVFGLLGGLLLNFAFCSACCASATSGLASGSGSGFALLNTSRTSASETRSTPSARASKVPRGSF